MSNWLWLFPMTVAITWIISIIKFEYEEWKKKKQ